MKVVDEGYVCWDCIQMIANGEVDPDLSEKRERRIVKATAGWVMGDNEENPDEEFSSDPCACCGTSMAGNRFYAAQLE